VVWLIIAIAIFLIFDFVVFFGAPYVPSHKKYVRRAFTNLYKVNAKDVVIDVGSGDGIILKIAREHGAKAVGYELNPLLVWISRLRFIRDTKVKVILANFWRVKLPAETTLVYAFSVSRDAGRLSRKIQKEADRLNHPIKLMCYGNVLKDRVPDKMFEAYFLYTFRPLQASKAQV
jgi:ubiquinone/menaquinone biosynthesis C-methylase UbiE